MGQIRNDSTFYNTCKMLQNLSLATVSKCRKLRKSDISCCGTTFHDRNKHLSGFSKNRRSNGLEDCLDPVAEWLKRSTYNPQFVSSSPVDAT